MSSLFKKTVTTLEDFANAYRRETYAYKQPTDVVPVVDDFSVNTLSTNYTTLADSAANWSVDTTNRWVQATSGSQAKLTWSPNGVPYSVRDVDIEVTVVSGGNNNDTGIAFRIQDNSNYYLLAIRNGSPGNIELYRRVGGAYTSLRQQPIPFPVTANSQVRVRVVAHGTLIRVFVNGTQYMAHRDFTFTVAGKVGLRHHGTGTTRFKDFAVQEILIDQDGFIQGRTLPYPSPVNNNAIITLSTPLALPNDYTIEALIKVPLYNNGTWRTLTRGTMDSVGQDHHVIVHSNGSLGVYANKTGTAFRSSGFNMNWLRPGTYRLTAVGSGGQTKFYIDGELVGTSPYSSVGSNIQAVGNYQGLAQAWGDFWDFRVWGKARTQEEIKADMHRTDLTGNESGLILYYKLNEGRGTVANDSTPNARHGTISNFNWWGIQDKESVWEANVLDLSNVERVGSSKISWDVKDAVGVWLDGNSYVELPNEVLSGGLGAVTIEAHVQVPRPGTANWYAFVGSWMDGNTSYNHYLGLNNNNWSMQYEVKTNTGNFQAIGTMPFRFDLPVHTALTYDGTTLKGYLDGQLDVSIAANGVLSNPTLLALGTYDGTVKLNGLIREVRFWSRALTQQELIQYRDKDLTGTEPGLLAWYKLDEGTGRVALDSGTKGSHGVLRGNAALFKSYMEVETSLDGSDWQKATNGGEVPQLTAGTPINNDTLKVRVTQKTNHPYWYYDVNLERLEVLLDDSLQGSVTVTHPGESDLNSIVIIRVEGSGDLPSSLQIVYGDNSELPGTLVIQPQNKMQATYGIIPVADADLESSITVNQISDLQSSITVRQSPDFDVPSSLTVIINDMTEIPSSLQLRIFSDLPSSIGITPWNKMTASVDVIQPPRTTVAITPYKDAFIREGVPRLNYGKDSALGVGRGSYLNERIRTLLGFDLSSIPRHNGNTYIDKVILKLYHSYSEPLEGTYKLYQVVGEWREEDVTWEGAPWLGNEINHPPFVNKDDWIEFDLTEYVRQSFSDKNQNDFQFYLKELDEVLEAVWFFSRETDQPPVLEVTYHDETIYSNGRNDLDSSIFVVTPAHADLPSRINIKSTLGESEIPSSIYVAHRENLDSSIYLNQPDLHGSITVRRSDGSDLPSSVGVRVPWFEEVGGSVDVSKPNLPSKIFIAYGYNKPSSITVRQSDKSELDSTIVVNRPQLPSSIYIKPYVDLPGSITVRTNEEQLLDGSLDVNKPDLPSSVFIRITVDEGGTPGSLDVSRPSLPSSVTIKPYVDLRGSISIQRTEDHEVPSSVDVSIPQIPSSIYVRYREDLPSSIDVWYYDALPSSIYVANRYDLPGSIETIGALRVPSSIHVTGGYDADTGEYAAYLKSRIIIPLYGHDDLPGSVVVRVRFASDLPSTIDVAQVYDLPSSIRIAERFDKPGSITVKQSEDEDLPSSLFILGRSDLDSTIAVRQYDWSDLPSVINLVYADSEDLPSSISVMRGGLEDLESSLVIQPFNKMSGTVDIIPVGDDDLPSSIDVYQHGNLPSSIAVRVDDKYDIPSSVDVYVHDNLPGSISVRVADKYDLPSTIAVRQATYRDLPSQVIIRQSVDSDLPSSIDVRQLSELPGSIYVAHRIDLPSSIEVITAYPYSYIM